MVTADEIDILASQLADVENGEQIIKDNICAANLERRWDEVVKWNRVSWRLRLLQRCNGRGALPPSPCGPTFSAAP